MNREVLVFDMDGVLAEVRESYLAAIAATVRQLTGSAPSLEEITAYKKAGGWNNDWALAQRLTEDRVERDVPYAEVVEVFQKIFLGTNHEGLILRETWIPHAGLLERLAGRFALAIFTGRPRAEIAPTLARFAPEISWSNIIADEDVEAHKPAPDGLRLIAAAHPGGRLIYCGDNVDDARSAQGAGVRFIGITDGDDDLAQLLRAHGAEHVIASVNDLETIL